MFGRFEASRPNELWTGDALHGPQVAGRKTYLFAFCDDHSRALVGYRWGYAEDNVRLAAALRPALASRGVPDAIYVDNGSAFVDAWLLRACAKLGIKLTHSTPGRPQGRGKIERLFRTVRDQFLVEITGDPDIAGRHFVADLAELNRLFAAWAETVYHRQTHSETGQPPWPAGRLAGRSRCRHHRCWPRRSSGKNIAPSPRPPPSPCTATPTRSTRPWPVGRWNWCSTRSTWPASRSVSMVFHRGRPSRIASADTPTPRPDLKHPRRHHPKPTGIDYAALIDTAHQAQLARGVNYAALTGRDITTDLHTELPGQLDLLTDLTTDERTTDEVRA